MKITVQLKPTVSDEDSATAQDLLCADKKEFFEVKQIDSQQHKILCQHHVVGVPAKDSEMLLMELVVNNFTLGTFSHRQFVFSFGAKGYIRFSGQDLLELAGANQLTLPLSLDWESKPSSKQANTPQMMSPNLTPKQTPN